MIFFTLLVYGWIGVLGLATGGALVHGAEALWRWFQERKAARLVGRSTLQITRLRGIRGRTAPDHIRNLGGF